MISNVVVGKITGVRPDQGFGFARSNSLIRDKARSVILYPDAAFQPKPDMTQLGGVVFGSKLDTAVAQGYIALDNWVVMRAYQSDSGWRSNVWGPATGATWAYRWIDGNTIGKRFNGGVFRCVAAGSATINNRIEEVFLTPAMLYVRLSASSMVSYCLDGSTSRYTSYESQNRLYIHLSGNDGMCSLYSA